MASTKEEKWVFKKLWETYRAQSLGAALWVAVRWLYGPFVEFARLLPDRGLMADFGCGKGVFANVVSFIHPELNIEGFDQNRLAVKVAVRTQGIRENIKFQEFDLRKALPAEKYDAVSMVDVLHHVPRDNQKSVIENAWQALKPGGIFLMVDIDDRPRWMAWTNYLHDSIQMNRPYLVKRKDLMDMLTSCGFVIQKQRASRSLYVPHIAFLAVKG